MRAGSARVGVALIITISINIIVGVIGAYSRARSISGIESVFFSSPLSRSISAGAETIKSTVAYEAMFVRAETDSALPSDPGEVAGAALPPPQARPATWPGGSFHHVYESHGSPEAAWQQKVELVTFNGDVIKALKREVLDEMTVARFIDDLEQDWVKGVPGARSDDLGVFVERFHLAIGDQIMHDECYVTEYFPQEGQEGQAIRITLIKQAVEVATYKQLRRSAERGVRIYDKC